VTSSFQRRWRGHWRDRAGHRASRAGIESPPVRAGQVGDETRSSSTGTSYRAAGCRQSGVPRGYMTKWRHAYEPAEGAQNRLGDARPPSSSISRCCGPSRLSRCSELRFVRAQRVAHSGDARLPRALCCSADSDRHAYSHQPLCQRQGLSQARISERRSFTALIWRVDRRLPGAGITIPEGSWPGSS